MNSTEEVLGGCLVFIVVTALRIGGLVLLIWVIVQVLRAMGVAI